MPISRIWEELDIIDTVMRLNQHQGSMLYILLYSDMMVGTTRIVDVNKYMMSEDILSAYNNDTEGVMLLHALILNNQELPSDIPADLKGKYELACLKSTLAGAIEFEEQTDIDSVIELIEDELENPHVSIEDFAVILYKKVPFVLQATSPSIEIGINHKKEIGVYKNA